MFCVSAAFFRLAPSRAPATPAYVLSVAGDAAQDRVLDALERDLGVKLHGVELGGGAVRLVEDA